LFTKRSFNELATALFNLGHGGANRKEAVAGYVDVIDAEESEWYVADAKGNANANLVAENNKYVMRTLRRRDQSACRCNYPAVAPTHN
jgi:hypothetical protein